MQRHRHQEFIHFLNQIERDVPAGKLIHVILDNYCTHKHAKVRAWLGRHPRWTPDLVGGRLFHFIPTSSSWLNAVEGVQRAYAAPLARRSRFTRQADPAQAEARRVSLRRRSAGRHQPRHRRTQQYRSEAIHVARRPR